MLGFSCAAENLLLKGKGSLAEAGDLGKERAFSTAQRGATTFMAMLEAEGSQ